MEINYDLLFDEIKQFVSNTVGIVNAFSDSRVPRLEFIDHLHHALQIVVIKNIRNIFALIATSLCVLYLECLDGKAVPITYLDLLAKLKHIVLQLVNSEGLFEDLHLFKIVSVDGRL
jgi:hypothetical protein